MNSNRPLKIDDIKKPELAEGAHPFAEEEPEGEQANANAPVDYRGAYETVGKSTGVLLLIMTITGFVASALPLSRYFLPEAGWQLGLFGWLVSWIIALPALVFAVNDLKAIRLGRYTDQGKWMVSLSFWLALLTVVNSISTAVVILVFGAE
ncbi:hypothetical protein C5Y96_24220 [Blastopirellula marina]|uniref:Uncharacterized protein n=1 Tax=Blastopirellula marina TaxID=124 RepID=A0A2S8EZZ5_9BACT|nr:MULTISPECIES: hypothetical protein [Pirellulaceae]PQO25451.1 hypothetical protein C5Y96_24220 [Blastopirellula marina]RCS42415.1 hypothetical protein DTL36_24270 [Bremerella cremea]